MTVNPDIPDKIYFKIGEAAEILGVEPHVLRFWESEFPQTKPRRAGSKQRLYRRSELELLFEIKRLLYDEKFTIAGAKKHLAETARRSSASGKTPAEDMLRRVKVELTAIKQLLEKK